MCDRPRVLVVDDDPIVRRSLSALLKLENFGVVAAPTRADAIARLGKGGFNVALLDVSLPDGSGFDVLEHIKKRSLPVSAIMMTGYGSIGDAVRAIKLGAFDYVTKPISDEAIKSAIERSVEQRARAAQAGGPARPDAPRRGSCSLVFRDPIMERVMEKIHIVAGSDTTVLITGESGTGKTLAANVIHENSMRAGKPFVEVSCGALPETLLESEIFGHVKGAFSGAVADKVGKFDAAHGGTLLLDEIGVATASFQVKLLRVLESFRFEPVGSNKTRNVDVRLILATNEDLGDLVKRGEFREDLYYRANVMNIHLPPLRERPDDIVPLARHFLEKYRSQNSHSVEDFDDATIRLLLDYEWPGNVRELDNVMQRALVFCRTKKLMPEDIDLQVPRRRNPVAPQGKPLPLKRAMQRVERQLLLDCLRGCDGNRKEAAERLGINRTTLYNKLHEHGIISPTQTRGGGRGKEASRADAEG